MTGRRRTVRGSVDRRRALEGRRPAGRGTTDRGSVLTMSLVLVTAMAISVTALAGYVQTSLRSERATATQVKRLSAADGALRLAVESLKRSSANCTSSMTLPALNGTQVTVRCTGNGLPAPTWTRHDLTATVRSPDGGVSTGRATVQVSGVATPCTASCTVTINAWLVE